MKKLVAVAFLGAAFFSCQQQETAKKDEFKTGFIDSSVLLEKYDKIKDENDKFKVKSEELGRPIQNKGAALEREMQSFQSAAQANGQAWAQQKAGELRQREQQILQERQQVLANIEQQGAKLQDSLVKQVKTYIKAYGKKEKYDYIFTTSDGNANVVYAKDSYDLTEKMIKLLNDEYKKTKK